DFRDNLLREEIRELQYAIVDNNRVEILDALCDIKYVNDGTANQMGVCLDEIYDELSFNSFRINHNEIVGIFNKLKTSSVDDINSFVFQSANSLGFTLENFK